MNPSAQTVGLRYRVPRLRDGWELPEETMPESVAHDEAVALLRALLTYWASRRADAMVARNLAVRWDEAHPKVGVDPDVCVLEPAPPERGELTSVRTWVSGHRAPVLAVEVVSESNPHKDYFAAPEKYAASGTGELWIFDPLLAGPAVHGGPFRIQVWARQGDGDLARVYAGDGPAWSNAVGGWLVVVDEGKKLRIADDEAATRFWTTAEEAALARVAELEAKLAASKLGA